MFVDKLYIKNYRCFGESPSIVEFSKSGLTALIGPNNVGKSTVLRVLEILLGDKWPSGRFSEEDFHNNELQNDIVLACTLTNPINFDIKNHTVPIRSVALRLGICQLVMGKVLLMWITHYWKAKETLKR